MIRTATILAALATLTALTGCADVGSEADEGTADSLVMIDDGCVLISEGSDGELVAENVCGFDLYCSLLGEEGPFSFVLDADGGTWEQPVSCGYYEGGCKDADGTDGYLWEWLVGDCSD